MNYPEWFDRIMKSSIREQMSNFVSANQSMVAGTVLFLFAYSVFAANAVLKQPADHPQPLWKSDIIKTSKAAQSAPQSIIPVRRVETSKYPATPIPVPVLRPDTHQSTNARSENTSYVATAKDVAKVQHLLEKLKLYSGPADGRNGPLTKAAIKKFEKQKILPVPGLISPPLIVLLENAVGQLSSTNTPTSVAAPVIANSGNPDPGMIARIQVGLINFGSREVAIDGVMGENTKKAIEQFQKRFNLKITGLPNKALIRKLESVGALTQG
ncbi:MAG: peptidoglycan-binding protein [Rhizobiaceae bacterium]|nr:peptidoglycan-binding protein [Rhizobiaceae bacterium]